MRALRSLGFSGRGGWLPILSAEQLRESCTRVRTATTDGSSHTEQPAQRQTVPKPGLGPGPGAASTLSSPSHRCAFLQLVQSHPRHRVGPFLGCSQSCSRAGPRGLLCRQAFPGPRAAPWDARGSVTHRASCVPSPWQAGDTSHMQSTGTSQGLCCQKITEIHGSCSSPSPPQSGRYSGLSLSAAFPSQSLAGSAHSHLCRIKSNLKWLNGELLDDPVTPLLSVHPRERKSCVHTGTWL